MSNKTVLSDEQIEQDYHVSWYIVVYKLILGIAEFVLGLGITIFGRAALRWYELFRVQELSEDPHDLLVRLTEGFIPNVLAHHTFLAIYLLILGGAKIAGVIGLIYKRNWGVDLLIGLTLIMLPFQLGELILHPSVVDFFYILIGLLIAMYLVNFRPQMWAARMAKKVKFQR